MPEYLAPGVYVEEIPSGSTTIEGVSTSTAGFAGETVRGPLRPTLVRSWTEFVRRYGEFIDGAPSAYTSAHLPYAVRGFFENGGARLVVARVAGGSAAAARLSVRGLSGSLELRATGPGNWGNKVGVTVRQSPEASTLFALEVDHADLRERFDRLSVVPGVPEFAPGVVNQASELVEITACPDGPIAADTRALLSGGTDAPAGLEDYLGEASGTGLHALAGISGISIMAAPGDVLVEGLAGAIVAVCESKRDRFAVTAERDPSRPAALIGPVRDTSWGATYYPWLRVEAPHLAAGSTLVPPHGHICGIYARVDGARGVHRPPANEQVRGAAGLSRAVTQAEHELLNPRGVNVIRDFRPQRGIVVWGARTMAGDVEWKYVNVRRFFIFLERSIEHGLQWVVFEPNTEPTWREVRRSIENFLTRLWRDGALAGDRVERAFFVRCDRTTMTQADIERGRLICEIGVAPISPAEFVILRLAFQTAADGGF
jgi:phage tail sheath protein FI